MPRRRPRMKARVAVERDGDLLLARHERPGDAFWCLPGGGVDDRETLEQAAIRELEEEAGVAVVLDGVVWLADGPGEGDEHGIVEVVFRGTLADGGEPRLVAASGDSSLVAIRWFPVAALPGDLRPAALARRIAAAGSVAALPAVACSAWR